MADLVRVFTCASVLALGGFSATSSMLACSSDPASTPAGDDDDDDNANAKKDAGGSTSSSSGSTTSSSSSSTGGPANCSPVGTFTFGKPTYTVTAPGKVCENYAKGGNDNATALGEFTITKLPNGDFSSLKKDADPKSAVGLKLSDNKCELGGGIPPEQQPTVDADGAPINAKLIPTQRYEVDGTKIVSRLTFNIESDPPGAKGTPCSMEQVANGIKN